MSSKKVVVMAGLPGSGKSAWLKKNNLPSLSSDDIRRLLRDDATDQTIHRAVFATLRLLLRKRLELGAPVTYIDATNLTPKERRPYIKIAEGYGARAEAVFFDTPVDVCKARNAGRNRMVPPEVIDLMAARLVEPSLAEGFAQIHRVTA